MRRAKKRTTRTREKIYLELKVEHRTINGEDSILTYDMIKEEVKKKKSVFRLLYMLLIEPGDLIMTLESSRSEEPIEYSQEIFKPEKVTEIKTWVDIFHYVIQNIHPDDYNIKITKYDSLFENRIGNTRYGNLPRTNHDTIKPTNNVPVISNIMDKLENLGIKRFTISPEPTGLLFRNADCDLLNKTQKISSFFQYLPSMVYKYVWEFHNCEQKIFNYQPLQDIFNYIEERYEKEVIYSWERDNRLPQPAMLVIPENIWHDAFLIFD